MNDQNRYRGSSWQGNPNDGRGSAGWPRTDESRFNRGSTSPSSDDRDRDRFAERGQAYGRYGQTYGAYNEDPFGDDRPFEVQDREYRGGGSGYGRERDYRNEWSGFRAGSGVGSGPYWSRYRSGAPSTGYAGRGPKGYMRSDDRIREDVCERLSENDEVDASEIEVLVSDRKVTLTGSVQNRRMKHIAEDLAEAVSGVDDVDNRITVTKPLLKDMADRLTGTDDGQHYANTGTKNGPTASSASGFQGSNGRP